MLFHVLEGHRVRPFQAWDPATRSRSRVMWLVTSNFHLLKKSVLGKHESILILPDTREDLQKQDIKPWQWIISAHQCAEQISVAHRLTKISIKVISFLTARTTTLKSGNTNELAGKVALLF